MDVKKYFERIGLELPDPVVPNSELLRKIHFAHCTTVPYENLDMVRGIPASLEEEDLYRKIVEEGRGGVCFELNGSLGFLLKALGYKVTDYAARYLRGESTIPMRRHRVLKVEATDGVWLCDVGVGEVCQREPVAMVEGLEQHQYGETYKLEKEAFFGWVLWDYHHGEWRRFYSFTEEPQLQADFVAVNYYCETHPTSPFNKVEMFSIKTPEGRKTLDGHIYKEFKKDQVLVKELTDEEMPEAYARFGLRP
jgi:N-hydroxyarylamine O-acetyltransferase